jgi:transcriptional regulator with XRE-family HTH domain
VDNPQHEWVSLVTSRQGAWERAGTIGHVSAASSNRLGDFLRASRARLDPADAGLIGGGSRRVPGLRREEVAVLAGVSADYYARLEQGRERNPSAQVIDAIGRALCLTPHARDHAYRLAGLSPSLAANTSRDVVHPALLQLLDSFPSAAAYVLSPAFDVLATNSIAARTALPLRRDCEHGPGALPASSRPKRVPRVVHRRAEHCPRPAPERGSITRRCRNSRAR